MLLKSKIALVYGFFECLLFVGFIFGWASIVYVLKQDGIFGEECDVTPSPLLSKTDTVTIETENKTILGGYSFGNIPVTVSLNVSSTGTVNRKEACEVQDARFSMVFSLSFGLFSLSFISGCILDKFGMRVARMLGAGLLSTCMYIWAFTTPGSSWLVLLGAVCGVGATATLVVVCSHGTGMAGRYSSIAAGFYQGAISSTPATTTLGIKLLYDAGVPRQYSLAFLATLLLVCFTVTSFTIFPRYQDVHNMITLKPDSKATCEGSTEMSITTYTDGSPNCGSDDETMMINLEDTSASKTEESMPDPSVCSSLRSSMFLLHLIWEGVLSMRLQFVFNVFNSWTSRIFHGDVNKVSYYTNLLGYMQALNLLLSLFVGTITNLFRDAHHDQAGVRRGSAACSGLLLTSVVGTALSCMFLDPVQQAGPETFMMVTTILLTACLQSFVYSISNCYFNLAFPPSQFGRLYGLMKGITGMTAFSMYGLVAWGSFSPDGSNWFQVDLFLVIICSLTAIHPINVWYRRHQQKQSLL